MTHEKYLGVGSVAGKAGWTVWLEPGGLCHTPSLHFGLRVGRAGSLVHTLSGQLLGTLGPLPALGAVDRPGFTSG